LTSALKDPESVTELIITDENVSELPPEIGRMMNVEVIWLWGKDLSDLPPEFARLKKLRDLLMVGNDFKEVPPEIRSFDRLETLSIKGSEIKHLPLWIGELTNLDKLYLGNNQLTELPPSIVRLVNLEILDLGYNQLTDLPPQLSQLSRLHVLDLRGNQLTELSPLLARIADRPGSFLGYQQTPEDGLNRIYGRVGGGPPLFPSETALAEASAIPPVERAAELAAIIDAMEAGKKPPESLPQPEDFQYATQRLVAYLEDNPEDVQAMILYARLGRAVNVSTPIVVTKGEEMPASDDKYAPLHAALARALSLEPDNTEAHYWQARLYGTEVPGSKDGVLIYEPRDMDLAILHARRAVELAPNNHQYREALGIYLVNAQRYDDAIDVFRPLDNGEHLMYRILSDLQTVPLPPGAAYLPMVSRGFADYQSNLGRYDNYPRYRTRVYSIPGPASVIEAAFEQQWSEFQLFETQRTELDASAEMVMYMQLLRWGDERLQPATEKEFSRLEKNGREPTNTMIMLAVHEMLNATEEMRTEYNIATADPFCLLFLTNIRKK
jgi:Leucine-rich repeat (LRR) protein